MARSLHIQKSVRKPLAPKQERHLALDEKEQQIRLALAAVMDSGMKACGKPNLSLRKAAMIYGVQKTTLTERYKGRRSRAEVNRSNQKLTPPQEDILKAWIKELGYRGIPMTPALIREKARAICGVDVGVKWPSKYCSRHLDLRTRYTRSLEACRGRALNYDIISRYLSMLADLIERYKIKPHNIWNMDEKGILLGLGKSINVIVDRAQKDVNLLEDGNRELVTLIEAFNANGSAISPAAIFKGQRRNLEWGRINPSNAR